jgi:hypothetical protein
MRNSFQTYENALIQVAQTPNLVAWNTSDELSRKGALIEAYNRLKQFGYRITWSHDANPQGFLFYRQGGFPSYVISPNRFASTTAADWVKNYPASFRERLCKAQILEAENILDTSGQSLSDLRRAGILSETTGESSMMFQAGMKSLDMGLGQRTLRSLSGILEIRHSITRS